ncbi:hypothetical protein FA95DRAFT_1577807, partial [Auriscalpium vulgare]
MDTSIVYRDWCVTAHGELQGKLAAAEACMKSNDIEYTEVVNSLAEAKARADMFEAKNKELRMELARLRAIVNDDDVHRESRRKTGSSSEVTTSLHLWQSEPKTDDGMRGLWESQWAPSERTATTATDPVFEDIPPRVCLGPRAIRNAELELPSPLGHTPVRGRGGIRTAQEDPETLEKVEELFSAASTTMNH